MHFFTMKPTCNENMNFIVFIIIYLFIYLSIYLFIYLFISFIYFWKKVLHFVLSSALDTFMYKFKGYYTLS